MGEGSTETVQEIEDVRSRLGNQIEELEGRISKSPDVAKKAAGGLAAAAATFLLFKGVRRRIKKRKASKIESSLESAAEYIPEQIREAVQEQDWRFWAGVGIGAIVLFRMSELRQLRRINKALRR
jgi:ElaB/YqjD/DUF883 family membrane-anchored ribosome-binding protein